MPNNNFWHLSFSYSGIKAYIKQEWDLAPDETIDANEVTHLMKTEYHEVINDQIREIMEYHIREAVEKVGIKQNGIE